MDKVSLQHGDVILKLAKLPEGAKRIPVDSNRFTVERGEGINTHDLTDEELQTVLEVYEKDGVRYFRSAKKIKLTHAEHRTQILEPGQVYEKIPEREFDYEAMETRRTLD